MVTDILVVGTGIAGLTYAIEMAELMPDAVITIVCKNAPDDNATRRAQGGIAVVTGQNSDDNYSSHIEDTCRVGAYKSDKGVVEMVVQNAYSGFTQLENWGCTFDKDDHYHYNLSLEAGHTNKRILHYKDYTGAHVLDKLLRKAESLINIFFIKDFFIKDLLITDSPERTCYGVTYINSEGEEFPLYSRITMLASGGIGQLYQYTTNPVCATGDGIAMAIRSCVAVQDMEFVQFHPTALYNEDGGPLQLITEALRGEGAILVNEKGEDFTKKYHALGSLAPRDIVSRAIMSELKLTNQKCVFLNAATVDENVLIHKFPSVYKYCKENRVDPSMIPVVPAAHYLCGGIKTDKNGKTSVRNLYASGECSRTGLHGANRLASNSLIESVVFAHKAADSSYIQLKRRAYSTQISQYKSTAKGLKPEFSSEYYITVRRKIKECMQQCFGVFKSNSEMSKGYETIKTFYSEFENSTINSPEVMEVYNMLTCAIAVAEASIARSENAGTFYNINLEQ